MPPTSGATLELGGKQRTIRYTMPALNKLEAERRGESVAETLQHAASLQASAITALVWAGLLHDDPKVTMGQAAGLIEPPFEPILNAITEGLRPWLKTAGEDDEGKVPADA